MEPVVAGRVVSAVPVPRSIHRDPEWFPCREHTGSALQVEDLRLGAELLLERCRNHLELCESRGQIFDDLTGEDVG